MQTSALKTRKPFKRLFPVKKEVLSAITAHMKIHGFDSSQPIVVMKTENKENVVIDGHTRLRAAQAAGIADVSVVVKEFQDEQEALKYAIHNQRDRRNMTDADILRCVEALDRRKRRGERTDLTSTDVKSGRSSQETAKIVGTSSSKVEKARTVLSDVRSRNAVLKGAKTINGAYSEMAAERRPKTAMLARPEAPMSGVFESEVKPEPKPASEALCACAEKWIEQGFIYLANQEYTLRVHNGKYLRTEREIQGCPVCLHRFPELGGASLNATLSNLRVGGEEVQLHLS